MTPRVAALWVFAAVMVLLVAALAAVVPWGSTGAATGSITPDATLDFSEAEIALGDRLARLLVVPGLTSTGVSLALTLALGLTPWGARIAEAVARPLGGGWFWQAALGGLVLLLIVRLADAAVRGVVGVGAPGEWPLDAHVAVLGGGRR